MTALHLNLLSPFERRSTSPVRARILLPVIAGAVMLFVLVWGGFVGVQLMLVNMRLSRTQAEIARHATQTAEYKALKAKLMNLQAEADQFTYYNSARVRRGEMLKRIASAVPEGITFSALSIPPPPEQNLKRPFGSKLPPLQGPTQTVERVELRLTGIAQSEQDVFLMMRELEGPSFTGLVSIVKHATAGHAESPRVLSFRQESVAGGGHRDVFFDIVYDIKPREFVK